MIRRSVLYLSRGNLQRYQSSIACSEAQTSLNFERDGVLALKSTSELIRHFIILQVINTVIIQSVFPLLENDFLSSHVLIILFLMQNVICRFLKKFSVKKSMSSLCGAHFMVNSLLETV